MTTRFRGLPILVLAAAWIAAPQARAQVTDLNPNTAPVGTQSFDMVLNGDYSGENGTPSVRWTFNGVTTTLPLSDSGLSEITAIVPSSLLTVPGIATVQAFFGLTPTNSLPFAITGPPLTLTQIAPNTAMSGGPGFNMTVTGTNFYPSTVVTWNGNPLSTTYVNSQSLTAAVPASLIANGGVDSVNVSSVEQTSPQPLAFNVTTTVLLTNLSPSSTAAGGPSFTLSVSGSGFTANTQITWNGTTIPTTFGSGTQVSATIPASDIAAPGSASVGVTVGKGQVAPEPLLFSITAAPLTLSGLSPNTIVAGSPAFSMIVLGSGFNATTTVTWNGSSLNTSFVSSGQLSALVAAPLVASPGTASVGVVESGQASPSPLTFTITSPFLLTSLSPTSAVAGGPAFTLTINGTGFLSNTVAFWNGQPLATTVMTSNLMTATVGAGLIAVPGTISVTAQSGIIISNALSFTVNPPPLTLTSISPSSAFAGDPALTLIAQGTGFNANSQVTWNGVPLPTTFISGTQLNASVSATLIAAVGTATVAVSNYETTSNGLPFNILPAVLTLTSLSPNTATVGGPAFTLTANGTGFNSASVVTWNGSQLSTTFVSNTQVTVSVPATLIVAVGTAAVAVQNVALTSNALPFTITASTFTLTSISPDTATVGGPAFTLTANGIGFNAGSVVAWNGTQLSTTFVSTSQLSAVVPANLIATVGTASVTVQNGSQVSNGLPFTITTSTLILSSISPNAAIALGPGFTLTANGTGFTSGSVVTWNGSQLPTTFVSVSQLSAAVPANLIATAGTASVAVQNSGLTSNTIPFTISAITFLLSSISPNTAIPGSPAFTLTTNGSGFTPISSVTWNGSALPTTFVSASQLTASVPASLIATAGTASVAVQNSGLTSNTIPFIITAIPLTLTSIAPNTTTVGGPTFTLTANGTGFNSGSVVTWNGSQLPTTFVSTLQLTASVPANLLATAGTASVAVQNGQLASNALPFSITGGLFTLTSIAPNTATVGGPTFTLTANGTGFTSASVVTWNGAQLPTTFVSATQVTASVAANLIATVGTASVAVQNGQIASNALPFSITASPFTLTSIAPNTAVAGSPTFTLTANGTGFTSASVVIWNGAQLPTTFVSATQVTASVAANLIATVGTASVAVQNGQLASNALPFSITASPFTLTSIAPNTAVAGSPTFTLTANGTGFTSGSVVTWNGAQLPTTFVSATQVTASVASNLLVTVGTASVAVQNGKFASNALPFSITASPFTLTSIAPNTAVAGSPTFTLTANGTGFTSGSVVTWNGAQLPTTFVSATQVTASVASNLIVTVGMASVAVQNGQIASNALPFSITASPFTLTSIAPITAVAGSPTFTLTANGTGFTSASVVTWNGAQLPTTFVTTSQLTASVPANLIATAGTASVAVQNAQVASNALPFSITANPFTLTSIAPITAVVGSPAFTLTANGTGFTSVSVVTWNGAQLPTTFVSATQVTASVAANLIATVGTASVAVQNGQLTSNALPFSITANPFTLTSIAPNTAIAGSPAFTLTANGTGFTSASVVTWNGSQLPTTFVSATQVTASVAANLIATVGTASVAVQNGQLSSNALPFSITASTFTLTSIAPNTATVGGPAFTLTANGTGFTSGSLVTWNGAQLPTTFVSATQITASVAANLIATVGTASVAVQNGQLTSNALPFTITPTSFTLTNISPNTLPAGGPDFILIANGTGFDATTLVTWNGTVLPTTFISATQLNATVQAGLVANPGTASVAAQNSLQTSNALPFTITQTALTLTSISPSSALPGSAGFSMSVSGTAFTPSTLVTWNGGSLATTFISSTQLVAAVPAGLVANAGTASVDVSVPGQVSPPALSFTIAFPALTITVVTPGTVPAGSPTFTLLVDGSGFTSGTVVFWNATPLATMFANGNQMTAVVPAGLLVQPGSASITAHNGNQVSNAVIFNISAAPLTLTSISPNTALAGGHAFSITANGTGFGPNTQVTWNGSPLMTAFVSTTQLSAAVPAVLIAAAGIANVGVISPGQPSPATLPFTISNFGLISLSPANTVTGGPSFTLTANGEGFTSGTILFWNQTPLPTMVVSATQLTASISAALIAQAGTALITASNGTQVSNALPFVVTAPPPVITSISPPSVTAGGATFTLTVNGTGFLAGAVVSLNGTSLSTTLVSPTQATATVPAASIALPATAQITLSNPTGQTSNAVTLTIIPPVPVITSISPSSAVVGSPAFSLNVTGTGFFAGATVFWNGTALNTSFISNTQVAAAVTPDLLLQPATIPITATNAGTTMSNAVNFTVKLPVPTITSISPASVAAGGPAFTMNVTGTNFFSGAAVSVNGTAVATTFVSSTQVTASVPASLILQPGTAPVTAANAGTASSNAVNLTITVSTPTITSISPSTVPLGGPAFTLTVNGTNFVPGAVVSVLNTPLPTTFVSSTQLTAAVPANFIPASGPVLVTVSNPGTPPSNSVNLTVASQTPTITSIAPTTVTVGGPAFTLTVNGTNFPTGATVFLNATPLMTTVVSATQLTAQVTPDLIAQTGSAQITVSIANGPPSNAVTLTITLPPPTLTSISPVSATAGDPTLTLSLTGTGFVAGTVAQWNGSPLSTTFVSSTQLTAIVDATRLAAPGTASVTVVNTVPNGPALVSNALTFTINAGTPAVITSLSKTSATAGDPAFTLTVTGTSFSAGAVVNFGTTPLATTFVSATQITAAVTAGVLLTPGTVQVTVQQSGTTSNALSFVVNLPPPPSLRLNPPTITGPAQQPTIDFGLNAPYPLALSGTVTITFVSNATVPSDDPAIQFASGGRTLAFTVPANTTALPSLQISTGTVAGTITLTVTLTAAGVNVTPSSNATAAIVIPKAAPVILPGKITLIRSTGHLEIDITAYSTTRDMTQAVFHLNPAPNAVFTSTDITVPLSSVFGTWYQSTAATAFGSQFTYAQQFSVVGDPSQIQSVTVTLTNSAGSTSATSN